MGSIVEAQVCLKPLGGISFFGWRLHYWDDLRIFLCTRLDSIVTGACIFSKTYNIWDGRHTWRNAHLDVRNLPVFDSFSLFSWLPDDCNCLFPGVTCHLHLSIMATPELLVLICKCKYGRLKCFTSPQWQDDSQGFACVSRDWWLHSYSYTGSFIIIPKWSAYLFLTACFSA